MNIQEVKLFDKYVNEVTRDTQYDRVNIEEVQLKLPATKAKWVSRLFNHKQELKDINDEFADIVNNVSLKIKADAPVQMSDFAVSKVAEKSDTVQNIRKHIKRLENTIEYLESVVKLMNGMTYDIKNSIDLIKLEQT